MIRTQVQLDEEQARRVKEAARLEGVSMAEMIRRCVDLALPQLRSSRSRRYEAARAVVGLFKAEEGDMAEAHDAYLGEAYE